jgi:hypothetical protein
MFYNIDTRQTQLDEKLLAFGGSTVVDHSANTPEIKGSNPDLALHQEKWTIKLKNITSYNWVFT